MAQRRIYVFLDDSYTSVGHVGTSTDPYSAEQMITSLSNSSTNNTVFLLRGTKNYSTYVLTYTFFTNVSLIAWDLDEYGPWRINIPSVNAFSTSTYLEDGIIQAGSIYLNGPVGAKRMYFDILVGGSSRINGDVEDCTFYSVSPSISTKVGFYSSVNNISRCAFIGKPIGIEGSATLNISNCITDLADSAAFLFPGTGTINESNITYGWTPPVKPTITSKNLTDFSLGGGTPSDITSIGGVGYGDSWANGKTYYVNFNESSTGNNGYYGEDCIGWDEFIAITTDGLTFKCRGSKTLSSDYTPLASSRYTIEAWNLGKYGPWRIDFGGSYSFDSSSSLYATTKNGILYNLVSSLNLAEIENMYVYVGSGPVILYMYFGDMVNSTLVGDAYISNIASDLNVDGCLIEGASSGSTSVSAQNNTTVTISNTKFGGSDFSDIQGDPSGTYVDGGGNEYSWSTPSLPSFSEIDLEEFAIGESIYGVINFPSYYYVDISTSNDTSVTDGSDSSYPATYAYLSDVVSLKNRSIFCAKGYRDITLESTDDLVWRNELNPFSNNKVIDWDNGTNGPWGIKANSATFSGISLYNGVVYTDTDISLSGYVVYPYVGNTEIKDMFFNASGQVKVGSGSKDIMGCNLISSGSPIAFFEEIPSWVEDGWAYIEDPFAGEFDSWWNSEFTTDANKFELEERPVGSGSYVAVQNGNTSVQLTPAGISLTGDFILEMCFALADVNTGNISQKILVINSSTDAVETGFTYDPGTLTFDNIGSATVSYSPFRKVYCRLTRTSGVITAEYSVDNPYDWIAVTGSHSYSDAFYLNAEGADNHGMGCFKFQAEGVTPGDSSSFPYGSKDSDTDILDSVIDTPAVTPGSWTYNSIDLQDVAQTDTTWSGTGITYTGTNQQNLGISWPSFTSIISDTKEGFSYIRIGSSISIPGSGSYTNYPVGLWGESRTGVGAFYFGLVLSLKGDATNFIYKDVDNEIVAKATFGGANYAVNVSFEPLYDTGATSWNWDFGDGGTSTTRSPTHEYVGEGVYTVSLYINGDTGTTETKVGYIVVVKELSYSVIAYPDAWYGGVPKTFDIGVTGATRPLDPIPDPPYEAFSWDLGNGDTDSNVTGLQYSGYLTEGTYTVEAIARDIGVSGLDYTKQTVSSSTELVVIGLTITVNPNALYINNPVSYTTTILGGPPNTLKWDFGDSSPVHFKANPGATYSVSHTFTTAGIFDAVLTLDEGLPTEAVFNYNAGDSNLSELRVFVSDLSPDFTVTPDSGKTPFTGLFTDASIGSPTGWEWDFGDGFTGATISSTILHTYTGVGVFNPLMTVYDIYGFNASVSKTVTVTDALEISIAPTPGNVPQTFIITPVNDSGIVQWDWEIIYDDPSLGEIVVFSKSTTDPLDKVFTQQILAPATYSIKLEATDTESTVYTVVEPFTVVEDIYIFASTSSGEAPLTVNFSLLNGQPSTISDVQWDFTNDGVVDSEEFTPSYVYSNIGTYTVSVDIIWYLNVEETSLITVNKTAQITVGSSDLKIGFLATPSTGKVPLTVLFNGISNNSVATWAWEISGIGTVSSAQTFSYVFNNTGTYNVTLTVVDSFSQTESVTRSIIVTDTTTTIDSSVDGTDIEASAAVFKGSGSLTECENGGVTVYIPLGSNEISPSGFVRKKGPSLIFD